MTRAFGPLSTAFGLAPDQDGWLYHVTFAGRLEDIAEGGLRPNAPRAIGGVAYDAHRKGKVFFTQRAGGFHWFGKVEEWGRDATEDMLEAGFTPVVLRVLDDDPNLEEDTVANSETIHAHAWFLKRTIPPEEIEVWTGTEWVPIEEWHLVDVESSYTVESDPGDEESGLEPTEWNQLKSWRENPLFPKELHP